MNALEIILFIHFIFDIKLKIEPPKPPPPNKKYADFNGMEWYEKLRFAKQTEAMTTASRV